MEDYKKKYEEALKRIKECVPDDNGFITIYPQEIFPELAENKNEKIRKALIRYFTLSDEHAYDEACGVSYRDIVAWLEAQGKQKSLDDVAKEITRNKETATSFLKSCGIMNANGELADEYKIEQGEQKSEEVNNLHNYLYGKQKPADKVEPKFKVGDTMRTLQEAKDGWTDGMPVVISIDNEYYHCNNESIAIKNQDEHEYPPMNRKHDICDSCDEKKSFSKYKVGDTIYYNSFGRFVSFVIANIVEDGTDNPMYEDKDGNSVFQNDIVEQMPDDMAEPKFKVGDWVVDKNGTARQILSYKGGIYKHTDGYSATIFEDEWRMWDIAKDAKDGDVIYSRHNTESFEWIGIFRSLDKENKRVFFYGFWNSIVKSFCVCEDEAYVLYDDFSPATKEQCDQLGKAMANAGYTFDFEEKELMKIEQKDMHNKLTDFEYSLKHIMEEAIECGDTHNLKADADMLLRLAQNQAEWSDEDERIFKVIHNSIDLECLSKNGLDYEEILNWFQSIKCRITPQQKQKPWSEEDENRINRLIAYFEDKESFTAEDDVVYANWLKSLKDRYTWKPSDKQMEALESATENCAYSEYQDCLRELIAKLKKLKEE